MAIKHVVTMGYIGSGSGVYFVPTLGYTPGDATVTFSIPGGEFIMDRKPFFRMEDKPGFVSEQKQGFKVPEEVV